MDPVTRASYDALARVWARTTDDNLWNEVLDRRPIRSLLPDALDGAAVLDVGTAAGAMAAELLRRGADVTGLDASPAMVEAARARCGGRGTFLVADLAEPLPFEAGAFDGIVASMVLHYLEDWSATLAELTRVLRGGGWLVVSLDHPDSPFCRAARTDYFAAELVADEWTKADVTAEVRFWRRPLSSILNAFVDSGLHLDRVLEPRVDDADLRRHPEDASLVEEGPLRVVLRWTKG